MIYLSTLASPLPSCPSPPVMSTLGGPVPSVFVILHRLCTHTAAIRCCCCCRDTLHSVFCKTPAILELTVGLNICTNNGPFSRINVKLYHTVNAHIRPRTPTPRPQTLQIDKITGAQRNIIGLYFVSYSEHNRKVYHMTPKAWRRRRGGRCCSYFCSRVSLPRRQRRRGPSPW